MKLHFLGHTEILLDIRNKKGDTVRILYDTWLTPFAFGDFMQRNPRWDSDIFDEKMDLIFISHPHCDHLDPYSLYQIYSRQKPELVIPENMEWFGKMIKEYLPDVTVHILPEGVPAEIKGLTFTGFTFHPFYETNERDVMSLFIDNGEEIIFFEGDIAIPDTEEAYRIIHENFVRKQWKSRIQVCVRNELEGFFLATEEEEPEARFEKLKLYRKKRKHELEWEFLRFEENPGYPDFYRLENFMKIYTGQGMIYPPELYPDLLQVSKVLPLDELVSWEKSYRKEYGYSYSVFSQKAGYSVEIENGKILKWEKISRNFLNYPVSQERIRFRKEMRDVPVFDGERDTAQQQKLIAKILERLYYYLCSQPEVPIQKLKKEKYTLRIRYGTSKHFVSVDYGLDFLHHGFFEKESNGGFSEIYWANDIEDFYNGRLDQFSSVLLDLKKFKSFYLWTMMGLPFLNDDIVSRKIAYHMERAFSSETVESYILPILQKKLQVKRKDNL